ncbi:MAG: hypothetical protein Q8O56_07610 [Solirubrobacteraceae bacterium]|nr:hypothetical protein [Solirubrobacteraceae bacterium]
MPHKGELPAVQSDAQRAQAAKRQGVEPASIGACNVLTAREASAALGATVTPQGHPICGYTAKAPDSLSKVGSIGVVALKATPRVRDDLRTLTGPRPQRVTGPWEVAYIDRTTTGSLAYATIALIKSETMVQISVSRPTAKGIADAVLKLGRAAAGRL